MPSGNVERTHAAHVDHARDAALRQAGLRRLVDRELVEELGREQVEVDLAVLIAAVEADRGGRRFAAVDDGLGEALRQAADADVQAFAVDVAVDLDAGDAGQRFGDIGVGKLADVFGKDRVGEAGRLALGIGLILQALAVTGYHHRVEIGRDRIRRRGLSGRRLFLRETRSGDAGQCQAKGVAQRCSCNSDLHETPLPLDGADAAAS